MTKVQHLVAQKIASHFRLSKKKLIESLDPGALADGWVFSPQLAEAENSFSQAYMCVEGDFNLADLFNEKKFEKSQLYQAALAFRNLSVKYTAKEALAYCYKNNVWAISVHGTNSASTCRGDGLIYINYKPMPFSMTMRPFKEHLAHNYPLPSL